MEVNNALDSVYNDFLLISPIPSFLSVCVLAAGDAARLHARLHADEL